MLHVLRKQRDYPPLAGRGLGFYGLRRLLVQEMEGIEAGERVHVTVGDDEVKQDTREAAVWERIGESGTSSAVLGRRGPPVLCQP